MTVFVVTLNSQMSDSVNYVCQVKRELLGCPIYLFLSAILIFVGSLGF